MAYYVYCDDQLMMASGLSEHTIINPVVELEKNSAGSFEFTMLPESPCYESLEKMKSTITVYEDEEIIFSGRAVKITTDFYLQKKVYCEGDLAFLNDTAQPTNQYHDVQVSQFLGMLIDEHNQQVASDRQFELGIVTVADNNDTEYRYTNYESTLKVIKEQLLDKLDGMIRVRYQGGKRYIDYLAESPRTCQQTIRFGSNMLDFSKTMSAADVATRVIPLGAKIEDSPYEDIEPRLTIKTVNDKSDALELPAAVALYGKITKVVTFDEITTAKELKAKGEEWLRSNQYEDLVLECKIADLHFIYDSEHPIRILDRVQVKSDPHEMDIYLPVTKLSINLADPAKTSITLGDEKRVSLTSSIISGNQAIQNELSDKPSVSRTRVLAAKMAKMLIDAGIGGYVKLTPNELYIMEKPTLEDSEKYWRWNVNGLAYTSDKGQNYSTAITMDGRILADFVTAGTMFADRIRGGTLVVGGADGESGTLKVKNSTGAVVLEANKSGVTVKGNAFSVDSTNFKLTAEGKLTAKNADITGKVTATSGKMKSIELEEITADKMYIDGGLALKARLGTVPSDDAHIMFGQWREAGIYLEATNDGLRIYSDNGRYINLYPEKGIMTSGTMRAEKAMRAGDIMLTSDSQIERKNGSDIVYWYDSQGKAVKDIITRSEDPWSADIWAD